MATVNTNAADTANPVSSAGGAVTFGAVNIGGSQSTGIASSSGGSSMLVYIAIAALVYFIWKGRK